MVLPGLLDTTINNLSVEVNTPGGVLLGYAVFWDAQL
jgi:hypothetical protein